jgi:molybdate transport system permease protein
VRGDWPPAGAIVAAMVLLAFLAAPAIALLARSAVGGALLDAAGSPTVLSALALSLVTTAVSLVAIVALGTPLAYLLARRRHPLGRVAEVLVDLPIVLPPSVAGLALLLLLGRQGAVGGWLHAVGVDLAFTTTAVVLAQVFVAAPFYIRSARSGFARVDRDLEDAARADGAPERAVFRHVTLPLAWPSLAGGMILAWARALGEFGATILFAGNVIGRTQTLPLVVYAEFQASLSASIAAAAILVIAALGILVAVRLVRLPLSTGAGD